MCLGVTGVSIGNHCSYHDIVVIGIKPVPMNAGSTKQNISTSRLQNLSRKLNSQKITTAGTGNSAQKDDRMQNKISLT